MKVIILLLFVAVTVSSNILKQRVQQYGGTIVVPTADTGLDWWQTAVFYQIYPRSFKDSDDNGIGDLKGIISKLDYLKDMGVTATWLSPIFKSPQVDQGYDISDYKDIDPDYGTIADLRELVDKAHALGIKIILDFVPNHTSDKHEWFLASVNGTEEYKDYYVWKDCKDADGKVVVPNNWISNFKGSAWEYNSARNQCYLHQFAPQQPDLNYNNPKVVDAMKDVLRFWMEFGVDGFRCDAVNTLFEDPDFRDEPLSNFPGQNENDYDYLLHIYTLDQSQTYDMIYQWREVLDTFTNEKKTETKVMMTEAYTTPEKTAPYYGTADGSRKGAHFTFNFNFIRNISKGFDVHDLSACIEKWLIAIPDIYTDNWVLGNHDNHRVANRLGKENVDALNMITSILPGVMVTYNGEEIGMEDGEVTCEQGHDPQAIKDCASFAAVSRDFERTPFQWDNSTNAGFSEGKSGKTPWLPVSSKYLEVNLAEQDVAGKRSHYNVYKELIELRKEFNKSGDFDSVAIMGLSKNVVQLIRETQYVEFDLIYNIGNQTEVVDFFKKDNEYEVVVASVGSLYKKGQTIKNTTLTLGPHDSLIVRNTLVSSSVTLQAIPYFVLLVWGLLAKIL